MKRGSSCSSFVRSVEFEDILMSYTIADLPSGPVPADRGKSAPMISANGTGSDVRILFMLASLASLAAIGFGMSEFPAKASEASSPVVCSYTPLGDVAGCPGGVAP